MHAAGNAEEPEKMGEVFVVVGKIVARSSGLVNLERTSGGVASGCPQEKEEGR